MGERRITRYRDFWPYYVREHGRAGTRVLHFIGTSVALALLALAAALGEPWLLLGAVIAGYFFAWISHMLVERNRPATFTYPFFSLTGDFHMYGLMWLGRMNSQVRRHGKEATPTAQRGPSA